jgi:hypothetical protein
MSYYNGGLAHSEFTVTDLSNYIENMVRGLMMMEIVAQRGPINQVTFQPNWPAYQDVYGDFLEDYDGPLEVYRAYLYGAGIYVNRIAHYTEEGVLTAVKSSATIIDRAAQPANTLKYEAISEASTATISR